MPLSRCFPEPTSCFCIVLRDTKSLQNHFSKLRLRFRITLVSFLQALRKEVKPSLGRRQSSVKVNPNPTPNTDKRECIYRALLVGIPTPSEDLMAFGIPDIPGNSDKFPGNSRNPEHGGWIAAGAVHV